MDLGLNLGFVPSLAAWKPLVNSSKGPSAQKSRLAVPFQFYIDSGDCLIASDTENGFSRDIIEVGKAALWLVQMDADRHGGGSQES